MTPIATIKLDHPKAAGVIRGIVAWDRENDRVVVLDPLAGVVDDEAVPVAKRIQTIDEALQVAEDLWGGAGAPWELTWLVEDPEDYTWLVEDPEDYAAAEA